MKNSSTVVGNFDYSKFCLGSFTLVVIAHCCLVRYNILEVLTLKEANIFTKFVINLDIIEDFLNGEGYKYSRLDGNTKQAERQKDMDEFNHPDSDVFIYLLSTRAGGVGINLWSADTVIIYDPDFNPHQVSLCAPIFRVNAHHIARTCKYVNDENS
jgi:SNF2 family DNA or RNA helicase